MQKLLLVRYGCSLLLHNKLLQNLVSQNNSHFICHDVVLQQLGQGSAEWVFSQVASMRSVGGIQLVRGSVWRGQDSDGKRAALSWDSCPEYVHEVLVVSTQSDFLRDSSGLCSKRWKVKTDIFLRSRPGKWYNVFLLINQSQACPHSREET